MFALVTIPLTLLVLSSLDLHKRRQYLLGPKRIIITANSTSTLLIVWLSILGSCYFRLTLGGSHCPSEFRQVRFIRYNAN
jgi:hypothetical protein